MRPCATLANSSPVQLSSSRCAGCTGCIDELAGVGGAVSHLAACPPERPLHASQLCYASAGILHSLRPMRLLCRCALSSSEAAARPRLSGDPAALEVRPLREHRSSYGHILSHWDLLPKGHPLDLSLALAGLLLYGAYFVAGALWNVIPLRAALFLTGTPSSAERPPLSASAHRRTLRVTPRLCAPTGAKVACICHVCAPLPLPAIRRPLADPPARSEQSHRAGRSFRATCSTY